MLLIALDELLIAYHLFIKTKLKKVYNDWENVYYLKFAIVCKKNMERELLNHIQPLKDVTAAIIQLHQHLTCEEDFKEHLSYPNLRTNRPIFGIIF